MKILSWKFLTVVFVFIFSAVSLFAVPVYLAVPALGEGMAKLKQWTPLIKYIEETCDIELNLVITKDNTVIKKRLQSKNYDLAFIDPFWYILWGKPAFSRPVIQAEVLGKRSRRVMLVVHKDSIFRTIEDLKNSRVAFTLKKESAAGFYLPLAMLLTRGIDPFTYFKESIFSETFQSILKSVAYGKLDAGFITSSVYNRQENRELAAFLRVIIVSAPIPQWILIGRNDFSNKITTAIGRTLTALSQTDEGRTVLDASGFSGFDPVLDGNLSGLKSYIKILEMNHAAPE